MILLLVPFELEGLMHQTQEFQQYKLGATPLYLLDLNFKGLCHFQYEYSHSLATCRWVKLYAEDQGRFFRDFASAYDKLVTQGVSWKSGTA